MFRSKVKLITAVAVGILLLSATAFATVEENCRQCHGDPPGGPTVYKHHVCALANGYPCAMCHPYMWDPVSGYYEVVYENDCTVCHGPDIFTSHPSCLTCHNTQVGDRRSVGLDFMSASRHIQTSPTKTDCQVCHDITSHMLGTILLKSPEDGSTITYTDEASGNTFCLGCHDDNSKATTPFSDANTPVSSIYNWDGKSISVKYNTAEVVSSNKYPPTVKAPNMSNANYNTVPDVQRALSPHANPALNKANGGTSDTKVPCLACHNSHGSPVAPLLYATAAYQPENTEDFCWDCHTNDPASPQKASDFIPNNWVKDYFGEPRWGMNDGTGFKTNWMGSFAYKNSAFMSSHLYPSKRKISDTEWPRSVVTCTSCHDPHGVDPGQTAAKAYMVPILKGTWLVSPFKEDRAPLASYASPLRDGVANRYQNADQPRSCPDLAYNNTPNPGGGYASGTGQGHEGFFIEDNTFGIYNPITLAPPVSGSWRSVLAANQTLQINRIAETDVQFGGLCLGCHPKTDLQNAWPGHKTVKGWGGATRDIITSDMAASSEEGPGTGMHAMGNYDSSESEYNAAYARGYRWGVNPKTQRTSGYIQKDYHQFTCSKCHSPHATNMPRLMVTNCLDSKGNHTSYSKAITAPANNCHSTQRNLAWNTLTPWIQGTADTKYTITATSNSGGTITPAGSVLVTSGASQTFTMTPNSGYAISDVKVDDVSQGVRTSYTFSNVTANHTIAVIFVATSTNRTITASAGTGGTISPSGSVTVPSGGSKAFTITANSGYAISDVKVDNVSQGAISSYTFNNVIANHTIAATFVRTYTITASAGTGGAISPSGSVVVNSGANQTFTITANVGYRISDVRVDGSSKGAISTYTFSKVTAAHTISATFSTVTTYTITATSGANGSISPVGSVKVNSGGSQTFTITANENYQIADVKVNNVSQGPISTYAFTNVTSNKTIDATFALKTYTISASAGSGGAISPSGNVTVNSGANQTFTITANAGYRIYNVKVDGVYQGAISTYTFSSVSAVHTIYATFISIADSYIITAIAGTGGAISPVGNVVVADEADKTFTITANANYQIADVKVDNVSKGAISSYTFYHVGASHNITATFTPTVPTYTVVASAGTGGKISPSGSITNWAGASQAFEIMANGGYMIADVKVDNVSQGPIEAYTFSGLDANHTISATFATAPSNTITASAGFGGAISPSGDVIVTTGTNPLFTVTPNSGCWIVDVKVDNVSQGAISSYIFYNVTADHTISATFGSPNQPPTANAGTDKTGNTGTAISFTGSGTDVDGTITGYSWNWGDGTANTNTQNASHTYTTAGTYTVTLTVTDNLGATGSDTAVVAINLAKGKTATASSTYSSTYAASKAVDGSTSTYWRSSSTGTQWLRVDLESAMSISRVKVSWSSSYYAKSFRIETSTDGTNWTQKFSTTSGTSTPTDITFTAASARYVRVYCTTANSSSYRVTELEVFQ